MPEASVIVVGSGAGGSVVAWELARAGHPVLVLEKGRNLFPGLGGDGPIGSLFSNDEVKANRFFENQDPQLEPRTSRTQEEAARGLARSFVGDVNDLPTTVGGGTVHWDGKTPRMWRQDFQGLSLHGPVPDANVADWPLTYDELAPFYDEVEARLGVQGDRSRMPAATLAQAPRRHEFAQRPNPPMWGGTQLAEGATQAGYHPYPFPMAVNSRPFDGRPVCNSCGFCAGFGCPTNARGGAAVSFLHHAIRAGAELRPRAFVHRIHTTRDGRRATGVSYLDARGRPQHESADVVVVAASAIETPRLLMLSGIRDRSGQLGRNLMFHFFTQAFAFFADPVDAWRGPSITWTLDDFVGPDTGPEVTALGMPYLKGGICEVGGTYTLLDEANVYLALGEWGLPHKNLMRQGMIRRHLAGIEMLGEDMPQLANRVDLDPRIRDVHGFPVPRITHSPHRFETLASAFYGPKLAEICAAAPGVVSSGYVPGGLVGGADTTKHVMGTARMGEQAERSVVDAHGRVHGVENLFVADGSVFTSSGGLNPSLTIMALALRTARHLRH